MINYNIFLIGMMGSGKTTVGKKLSKKLKMNFVDTDYQIESIMSMSISQIFNEFGENRFRAMESSYFIEKSKENGIVFSTGGGIINNKKTTSTNGVILIDKSYFFGRLNFNLRNNFCFSMSINRFN